MKELNFEKIVNAKSIEIKPTATYGDVANMFASAAEFIFKLAVQQEEYKAVNYKELNRALDRIKDLKVENSKLKEALKLRKELSKYKLLNFEEAKEILDLVNKLYGGGTTEPEVPENPEENEDANKKYILKYSTPATDNYEGWEKEALPLGNGTIGNKIFGFIGKEKFQFNEKTLWSGGPMPNDKSYNGGNYKDKYQYIPQIRKALEDGDIDKAKNLAQTHLVGPYNEQYGRYLNFGEILLDFTNQSKESSETYDYQRKLDINDAIHKVSYTQDNTKFTRESFVSYPDNVAVTKISKSGSKNLDLTVELKLNNDTKVNNKLEYANNKSNYKEGTTIIENDGLLLKGRVKNNDLKFASYVAVDTDGSKKVENNKLVVENATYIILIQSAKTDYALDYKTNYRDKDINVENYVKEIANKAKSKTYDKLKTAHINDYKALFDRLELNISEKDNRDTDKLLEAYKSNKNNYLEELFFQYGRYLLISSSREAKNALPANLQGVWNAVDNPPWNSDYHMNINLQMNYWPAYSTNLADTTKPLINFVDDLRYYGRIAAKEYAGISSGNGEENGWLAHTQVTPFGWTTPGWNYYWGWSPAANAWIMQNVYDYYRYTGDREYLREKIYPMLKETTKFWNSFLHYDKTSQRWVSSPSYSPEHGTITIGNTFDQSLIWQLFTDFIEAAKDLNVDSSLVKEIKEKRDKLSPLHINKKGMIKEWYEEDSKGFNTYEEKGHRHISHLVGLFPGSLFDTNNKEIINAAIATLNDRGDGGTGWSKANKINLWARLLDGNRAHKLLSEQLIHSTHPNLWDTHPPYQIDGNLGATSGIAEMLVQSHLGRVQLLPALPNSWKDGSIRGIMARGNFEVSMKWNDKLLNKAEIKSKNGGELIIEYPNIAISTVKINGKATKFETINESQIKLNTKANDNVTIENIKAIVQDIAVKRLDKTSAKITFNKINEASSYIIERETK